MGSPDRFCKRCDYDLSASPAGACPECGRGFDPAEPKSFSTTPRVTWRGRLRRWRWSLAMMVAAAALWPGGVLVMTVAWVDPAGTATIRGRSVVVGRPWWLGGWWRPISWSTATGETPAPRNNGEVEQFTISIMSASSPWLWKMKVTASGRLAVTPVPPVRAIPEAEWRAMLMAYARELAAASGKESAEKGGMAIMAGTPPWAIESMQP